ncbi:MAG TPA: iron ABC transporter permease [Burkholderiaceae bacterium]|jgi:iron complex transport system permease protein|nr:iron ABC transporter permease [Burkholderiaceae bacterium]HRZ00485.1 iron ABC transporter permease [Burkholderiaceae bacterium]
MRAARAPLAAPQALALLAVLACAALLAALGAGSVALAPAEWLGALFGRGGGVAETVVWQLRLPRALTGFAVGGLLALAGALLQGLLRNPLADPYVLGISGGAALAALLALLAGWPLLAVQGAAAAGAAAALALLFALAHRALFARQDWHGEQAAAGVLLTGVMIASLSAALLALLLSAAPEAQVRPMLFWLLGDLGGAASLPAAGVALAALAVLLAVARSRAGALDLMLRGDAQAHTQGVAVARERRLLVALAACATGVAVTLAGAVGFVGFVAPHLMRFLMGNAQRALLPASVLAGGTLVVLADTLARTAVAPLQLPVGVVTALIGAPLFLWLLTRR